MPKLKFKKKENKIKKIVRITNDNIAQQREEVIAQGKKFKYPFQYTKHRLVVLAILVAALAAVLFGIFGWLQLYKHQNTGDIAYRFTRVIPLPIARVDNTNIRYSDYLAFYRSSVIATEQQQGSLDKNDDGADLIKQYKRQAMNMAEECTYAKSRADEFGVQVSEEDILKVEKDHRDNRSEKVFRDIVANNFGLSLKEYRRMIELSLYRKKVAEAMDSEAKKNAEEALTLLKSNGGNFSEVAKKLDKKVMLDEATVPMDSMNLDGGRATEAIKLDKGEISPIFVSKNGDGYYIVSLTKKTKEEVSYRSLWIRFTKFSKAIQQLRKDNKIKEYIELQD